MGHKNALNRDDMIEYVMSCWDDEAGQYHFLQQFIRSRVGHHPSSMILGGFGSHPQHDAHIHATLNAIQILIMQDALDRLDTERVVSCELNCLGCRQGIFLRRVVLEVILSLQNASGSFSGDRFGEVDTRFGYIAVSALSLLGRLDGIDKENTIAYIRKCRNFDGGFGASEGAETHSAQGEWVVVK